MEIEKTRETSWKIQLKNKDQNIEITSVEFSGQVRLIKLSLLNKGESVKIEMNREEFFNLLSLISAFKDVVIGEDNIVLEDNYITQNTEKEEVGEISTLNDNFQQENLESSENSFEKENSNELDPEEWDPW